MIYCIKMHTQLQWLKKEDCKKIGSDDADPLQKGVVE